MFFDLQSVYQPYSANDLLAVVFICQTFFFALTHQRTREKYFLSLSIGTFLAAIAWGTTRLQSPGRPYLDWDWFWAQPIFAGMLVSLCIGMIQYLPLTPAQRQRMMPIVVLPQVLYLTVSTTILLFDMQVLRLWIIILQMPTIIMAGVAGLRCERQEPHMGHALIGLAILSVPVMTVLVALSGATTLVLRFWTGIPAVIITQTILTASLLRDRQQLKQEVEQRREAEAAVLLANSSLERKVTERTAELKSVIQALESFNRNVSHDLRGPLGGIDMLAFTARQQLERGHVDAARQQLQLISDQVRESQSTISSMLLLAKTYEQEIQITTLNLGNVVRSAAREAYMSLTSGQAACLTQEVMITELGSAQADASILRIIFVNLITNALKFNMDQADVKVEIGRLSTPDGQLQLFVRDNGVGFETQETAEAFQAFRRFSNASKVPGFGLGLNIVRLAVDRLGGHIEVQSNPGQGACFTFTLPQNGRQ